MASQDQDPEQKEAQPEAHSQDDWGEQPQARAPATTVELARPGGHTGPSIRTKLIAASMVLLVIVIGLFALVNSIQSKRIIDGTAARLEGSITESLRRAGRAQLTLLAGTSRISLVQSDYTTLQTIVQDIGKQDERVLEAAVVDRSGKIVAHSNAQLVGKEAAGSLRGALSARELSIRTGESTGGQRSMVFAAPVHVSGSPSSVVFLAYSLKPLEAELAKANALRQTEVRASLLNTLLVGLLAIAIGVVLTVLQGLRITRPIQALVQGADRIASGELQARVEVREKDEIGLLGDRFNYMAEQVLVLMEQTKETASMERELEVAATIQTKLVPEVAEVELPGLHVAGYFQPAARCGGDWWHYYQLEDGRIVVLVGDVTGHGIPSAMITAVVKGAASNMIAVSRAGQLDLNRLLKALDVAVHEAARGELCMTCFASVYDPKSRTVTFANAGHPFPLICKAGGEFASLVVRGDRLGDLAGRDYEVRTKKVDVGDHLIWYTDGIIEGEDPAGHEFREKRFRNAIRRNAELGPKELRDAVIKRFHQFLDGVPHEDDVTLVMAQVVNE